MKNAFDGVFSGQSREEERISELEDMSVETSKTEKQRGWGEDWKEKKKKNKTPQDLWDYYKQYNICNTWKKKARKE